MYFKIFIFVAANVILQAVVRSDQSSTAPNSINDACGTKVYWDKSGKSYEDLQLFAMRNFNFDTTLSQLCKKIDDDIKLLTNNGVCFTGNQKEFFNRLIDGYKTNFDLRCSNKQWYEDYLKHAKCLKAEPVSQSIVKCADKFSAILDDVVKNIPHRDQGKVLCCNAPVYASCTTNIIKNACGNDAAQFAAQTLMTPVAATFGYLCQGMTPDFCSKYPKAVELTNKVFASQQVAPYGNMLKVTMEIAKNTLDG